ncbi:MAG: helix-turn-helix transcriptional regulator [Clostridia bacterium]|nr:helix-turn-helix transcriptional regulator [Clostridia bacterium]
MTDLGKRLKDSAKKADLSYSEIEEKLEVEAGTFQSWISGKTSPDTDTVNAIAKLLGVSSNYLLFGKDELYEIKAMFPKEAKPDHTPMSDWRFLAGAIMVFVGIVGILMMYMRYSAEGIEFSLLFEIMGVPAIIFALIAVAGAVLCIVSSIVSLHVPKEVIKKAKEEEKKKEMYKDYMQVIYEEEKREKE